MSGISTKYLKTNAASAFKNYFANTNNNTLYMFFGKQLDWEDDLNPPIPKNNIFTTDYGFWDTILSMKRIYEEDISHAIPRYDWESGKIYRQYDSTDVNLYDTPSNANSFFVLTDDWNVYKCIFNNKGALSVNKPSTTDDSSIEETADGYRWKFMYKIDAGKRLRFVTNSFIPIQTLTKDDNSPQWSVQTNAKNGAIHQILVTNSGNYQSYTSNVSSFDTLVKNEVILKNDISTTDDWINSSIYISEGLGSGQIKKIIDWDNISYKITVDSDFSADLDSSSKYIIAPNISISGDGTLASAYADVVNEKINKINIVNSGQDYTYATITIESNAGSGGDAYAVISPKGGHGADALSELGGYNIITNVIVNGNEANTFSTENDFRVIGLIENPTYANNDIVESQTFDQTTWLTVSAKTGIFENDELIRGETSGATARIVEFANTIDGGIDATNGVLRINEYSNGTFSVSESLKGTTSNVTATIDAIKNPLLKKYSGKLLYLEHNVPIDRAENQQEDIKLIIQY